MNSRKVSEEHSLTNNKLPAGLVNMEVCKIGLTSKILLYFGGWNMDFAQTQKTTS